MSALGQLLRNRDFSFYWVGIVVSNLGTRATQAAVLYQVYQLSDSISVTGFVGAAQGLGTLVLNPIGGVLADRMDRRRLLQVSQSVSLLGVACLAALTFLGHIQVWQILVAVLFVTAASSFDRPARTALIPALVRPEQLPEAVAVVNPSRELAILVGPAFGGLLMAVGGVGWVYVFDAFSYAVLVVLVGFIRVKPLRSRVQGATFAADLVEGARYVAKRPIILQFIALDLSAQLFGAYRVVLPALATDVLHIGELGYGILSSLPSAGALLATWTVFRVVRTGGRQGILVLYSTMAYGVACIGLGWSSVLWLTVVAALVLGWTDALATVIRHSAVQLDTPDELRGRVTSLYQVASGGGPSFGQLVLGALASALGPAGGMAVGGLVTVVFSGSFLLHRNAVRAYDGPKRAHEAPV
jgi:MFS family permease